ncbi:MAG: glycosyltransferase family 2 protein [Verrucomicrobiota bacterium]
MGYETDLSTKRAAYAGTQLMKISIITPSFNQAEFLESTLQSVLSQTGIDLEYIVVDGGSTDGSKEIIEKHSGKLAWWCSEPDGGQYQAINKGFEKATGEILAWLNSSDIYLPWTLTTVSQIFSSHPGVNWLAANHKLCIGEKNEFAGYQKLPGYSRNAFIKGMHGSRQNTNFIQQETCFWRRSLWDKIGGRIPDTYKYAADFHLWSLMFERSALTGVECPLAAFRYHDDQRSKIDGYMDEVEAVLAEARKSSSMPSHHAEMPVAYLKPSKEGDEGFGRWVLSVMENDNFIFEVDNAEVALQKKERVIEELNTACIDRLAIIERLRSENTLKFQLERFVRHMFNKY